MFNRVLTDALYAAKNNREQGKGSPVFDKAENIATFLGEQGI